MTVNFLELPVGPEPPTIVNAVIEIASGSSNKYEYDKTLNVFKLDRTLFSPVHYPGAYGFIPQTHAEDDDPLDILVLLDGPTYDKLSKKWKGILSNPFDHDDGFLVTSPVASYRPNPLGVYDIYGNVQEWCRDGLWWSKEERPSSTDPFFAPLPGSLKVLKGGSYVSIRGHTRSGKVAGRSPDYERMYSGLRVVAEIVTTNEAAASSTPSDGRFQD